MSKSIGRYLILITLFILSHNLFSEENFTHSKNSLGWALNEHKITYFVNNYRVGFISYSKIPFLNFFVIHNFYIEPSLRNQGYGKSLLSYTLHFLTKLGSTKIYIQPGPFEIKDGWTENITDKTRDGKLHKLVKLYEYAGFELVNTWISWFAQILYKIIGIPEDAKYLMVFVPKEMVN